MLQRRTHELGAERPRLYDQNLDAERFPFLGERLRHPFEPRTSTLREAEFGETSEAKRKVTAALALVAGRDVHAISAIVFARIADTA